MNSSNVIRRIVFNLSKPKINIIPYEYQYEPRDFIRTNQKVKEIINYHTTESFKNYKPNLKSYYE